MQGKAVEASAVILDAVVRPLEVYMRCRAWFMTLAYVTIRNRSYFDLQAAVFASEKVLQLVSQTFNGHVAPTTFYVSAWAATVHYFVEQARITSDSLSSIVRNTGAWEHKWTCWQPSAGHSGGAARVIPDAPAAATEEVDRLRAAVKAWQSKADSHRLEADELRRASGSSKGGSKSYGKGSKGNTKRERDPDGRERRGSDQRQDRGRGHYRQNRGRDSALY